MAEPAFKITDIIIDCVDPERVASFWAELLRLPVEGRKGPYVWLQRAVGAAGVGFQRVTEKKSGKNRVHLDICAPDLAAAKLRIEALGGRRVHGYEAGGFLVMADPEGNEFCVVPIAPFHFDDEGRTDYLDDVPL